MAFFSSSCCLALGGSKRITGSCAFTGPPGGASHTILRSGTLLGAVNCTVRLTDSSPRQRTMTANSPLRTRAVGGFTAAWTLRMRYTPAVAAPMMAIDTPTPSQSRHDPRRAAISASLFRRVGWRSIHFRIDRRENLVSLPQTCGDFDPGVVKLAHLHGSLFLAVLSGDARNVRLAQPVVDRLSRDQQRRLFLYHVKVHCGREVGQQVRVVFIEAKSRRKTADEAAQ